MAKFLRAGAGRLFQDGVALNTVRSLIAFLLFFITVFAVDPAHAQSFRFSSVSVEGNQRIEAATIASQAGIEAGQTISAGELNAAAQRIRASGLFETVEVEPRGNTLVIRVVEFPTINAVAIEGNKRLSDENLLGFIETEPSQVFSPTRIERDVATLSEAYEQNGRVSARITPKVIRRSENRVDVVFEVFEGRPIEVRRIGFVGNKAYSDRRLRRVIGSKQAGLLRAIVNRDTFVADRLEFDRQVLTDFYQSRGYVDFRVTGTNAELARERDGFFITFNIQEGQQFRFGDITTVSEMPGVEAETYQNVLKIKPGVVYSPTLVENSIARMERQAIRDGIDFLRVEPRITRNDRTLTLDVEFVLSRGPRVFVERIDIEGNTTTLDRVIRRQFDTVEGDPFNPREIRQAAQRIRALRFFSSTNVNAREGSRPDQVVVDVDVEETTTGSLSFGANFSSDAGLGFSVGFTERNFLGRGQGLSANIIASSERANYSLTFSEPAFLGRDVSFGFRTSLLETSQANSLFDTTTADIRPSLGFPLGESSRLNVFYELSYSDMTDYPVTGLSPLLAAESAESGRIGSSVGFTYSYDTRRTGLNPNAGVLLEFGLEYAGLGGDQDFIRPTARLIGQTRVFNEEVTLRATLRAGALEFLSGDSRSVDRFTQQVIRGFDANGLGPVQNGEHLGGTYFASAQFDAEFPLGLPDEFGITGGLFYDVGSIWGLDTTGPGVASEDFNLRHVVGFSLFWESPFGPLRLNFSRALESEPDDVEREFDITVRTNF
ncbi:outer membrane protein assembly factor BamA [Roseovarius rhodophyticola]|uniref:Outer membrane protein assembly factor BamA n=1 Tax=Roseovarius rhodophyticola TaxID=3080827 RepID=A0ABZ2TE67_9RHOB